ncbi:hypothetical protein Tco_0524841 [Tanacetum coccineum]
MSDATLSCEPIVSPLNENEIDFRISFDEFDDEDYMVIFNNNSFSYKIISVDNLKTDSENDKDKVNMPSFPSLEPAMPLNLIKNLYVSIGILFDHKRYYKNGVYTRILQRPRYDMVYSSLMDTAYQGFFLNFEPYTTYPLAWIPYQRRMVRLRTGGASTSAAPLDEDQLDP